MNRIDVDRLKTLLTLFDFPSGVILTLHTLSMIAISWISVVRHYDISTAVITIFGMNLGAFAVHKTSTAITTITTQANGTPDEAPKQ